MALEDLVNNLTKEPTNHSEQQYLRNYKLVVYSKKNQKGLDLSELRFKFNVKRSDTASPNSADIRVYNLSEDTALSIFLALSPAPSSDITINARGRVILQAGYQSNYGVIFQGNIKQIILGRENATDTFIDIVAGDGDTAYNFAFVNQTLASGATQTDQIDAVTKDVVTKGVSLGHVGDISQYKLPRGKTLFGNARNYYRTISLNTDKTWSIQDEKVTFIDITSYLPGEAVVLTSKTGLVGTPNQTNEGVNLKCLLNPLLRVGGRVDISEATVADLKINAAVPGSPANAPAAFTSDGVYYIYTIEHSGDTRGVEWYTTALAIATNPTGNPRNAVQVGFGG